MSCKSCFEETEKRVKKLQKELVKKKVDALVIQDTTDLFYLTGLELSAGFLLISPKEILLLVDGRYIEAAAKGPLPSKLVSDEAVEEFFAKEKVSLAAFDGQKLSYSKAEELKTKHPVTWISLEGVTKRFRMVKSSKELELLANSAALLWEGFLYIESILKEGIEEKDVIRLFTIFCLEKGAEGLSFDPIIAFGEGSAMPHYKSGSRKLKKGDVVLIDIGVYLQGYASDMTRVLFFGEKNPQLAKFLELTKAAQKAALDLIRPGVKIGALDEAARKVYKAAGVEEYFVHTLGHGIGLEVHEYPRIRFQGVDSDLELEEGMVFTVEPGLYLPGVGGVRYEDTVAVQKEGYLNFFEENHSFPI